MPIDTRGWWIGKADDAAGSISAWLALLVGTLLAHVFVADPLLALMLVEQALVAQLVLVVALGAQVVVVVVDAQVARRVGASALINTRLRRGRRRGGQAGKGESAASE